MNVYNQSEQFENIGSSIESEQQPEFVTIDEHLNKHWREGLEEALKQLVFTLGDKKYKLKKYKNEPISILHKFIFKERKLTGKKIKLKLITAGFTVENNSQILFLTTHDKDEPLMYNGQLFTGLKIIQIFTDADRTKLQQVKVQILTKIISEQ